MNWLKRIFCSQEDFNVHANGLPKVSVEIPMPKVKPTKGSDISEPVFAMLNAWKQDPKRFKVICKVNSTNIHTLSYGRNPTAELDVVDTKNPETFKFGLWLDWEAYKDMSSLMYHFLPFFGLHKIYPVLGCKVHYKPSWMTQDELDFIAKTVTPYYLKRVNRYRDIVESRIDRTRKASELKSEIAKQKERDRLVEIYK